MMLFGVRSGANVGVHQRGRVCGHYHSVLLWASVTSPSIQTGAGLITINWEQPSMVRLIISKLPIKCHQVKGIRLRVSHVSL